ncbi:MAG: PEP-utilizing enzyme [Candidatus Woykebacteria bacterium]
MASKIGFIFDNSNLNESYSGVTTPLTYSFAKRAYEKVYVSFCKLFGVSNKDLTENADLFPNMLAFIGGSMYYHLINWHRLIALLPGYRFNGKFLEQMLGVDEEYFYEAGQKTHLIERLFDLANLFYRIFRISISFVFMKLLIRRFNETFDRNFSYLNKVRYDVKDDKELVEFYESFEETLTKDFSTPIANDFAVMISVGILKKLTKKWLDDKDNSKANYFISGGIGLKSAEPGKAMQEIARTIFNDEKAKSLFKSQSSQKILSEINSDRQLAEIRKKIRRYIEDFGSRMPGELKLESISFQDDPLVLIKLLKNSLRSEIKPRKIISTRYLEIEVKNLQLFKRLVFNFILNWSESSIKMREETRFKRSLIFGIARKVFREFGKRLEKREALKSRSDVFYLEVEEIFTFFRSHQSKKTSFIKTVAERKSQEKSWKSIDLPRRITTNFTPEIYNKTLLKNQTRKLTTETKEKSVKGDLASQGKFGTVIEGRSLVVVDFDPNKDYSNKILVTKQTDPGWTIIFPSLRGLVVERGGSLSHAAIVAREFGIPCIINASNATKIIPNDKEIKMDLETGLVALNG